MLTIIFSVALFCSAFLSFSVQPMLGKMMLPMVGGAPAGWIVAMAFFQITLLGGYGISWLLGRLNPWVHAIGLIGLYIAGFLFLPPHLAEISDDVSNLSLTVVIALAKTIMLPFLALTATTAALQRVFSTTSHTTAKDPYYLFVASNFGSFAGLLSYPFWLEPDFGLKAQSNMWQVLYIFTIGLICAACAIGWRYRLVNREERKQVKAEPVSSKQILSWLCLAFVPCSLSMGVTNLITMDIGGLPLFWVLPLGLYLLTFILAFAKKQLVSTKQLNLMHLMAAFFMIIALAFGKGSEAGINIVIFVFLVTLLLGIFFVIAWGCHQKLANQRPQTEHLTLYYFIIALGGGFAGLIHAFVIPFVLKDVVEFQGMVILSLLLLSNDKSNVKKIVRQFWSYSTIIGIAALMCGALLKFHYKLTAGYYSPFYIMFVITAVFTTSRPRLLAMLGVTALVIATLTHDNGVLIDKKRNFFGQYAVYDYTHEGITARLIRHGNTIHGIEVVKGDKPENHFNYGYYATGNPISDALKITNAKTMGVVGLGSGQMACYDQKLVVDFYEIDPDIEDVARNHFTYLTKCPPRNVFIGDGRKEIEKENRLYDVITIDAFTSDGIPLHLLTKEALAVYQSHLTPKGMLLFHVSNRYLNLKPLIGAVAETNGLHAYAKTFKPDKKQILNWPSKWVTIPLNADQEQKLQAMSWQKIVPPKETPVWTDDRSSLLPAISERSVQ